ncbi:MAG: LapA family protein [Xanthomonadales bacterium]|nr:LapA family protein [Xanthomonadales bacterium]
MFSEAVLAGSNALYRIGFIIVIILAAGLGILIGALNPGLVAVDLLWAQFEWPLGLLVLSVFAAGLLFGLALAWLLAILPLRVKLRRLLAHTSQPSPDPYPKPHD